MSRGTRLRSLLAAVAATLLLLPATAQADVIVDGSDSAAPVITDVTTDPTSIDVSASSATVTIASRTTDNLSGVNRVVYYLRHHTSGVTYGGGATRLNGTVLDGTWRGTITVPKWAPSGTYDLTCAAYDEVGNYATCGTAAQIDVVGGDAAPPVITDVTTDPTSIDVSASSATVTIASRTTDNLSGVNRVVYYLRHHTSGVTYGGGATRLNGTVLDGTWRGTITVPKWAPSGTYDLTCAAYDEVGNYATCGTAAQIDVVGGDAAPPVITDVTTDPTSIDVSASSATVTIASRTTDNLSGVNRVVYYLRHHTSGVTYGGGATRLNGTVLDGTWRGTITVPKWAPSGTYDLTCAAYDEVGNYATCGTAAQIDVHDPSVDLKAALSSTPTTAAPGHDLLLSATVTNTGPGTPVTPRVEIAIPAGTSVVATPPGCSRIGSGPITCDLAGTDLQPGESVTRTVGLRVTDAAAGTLEGSATASSSSVERTPADNTATISIPIAAPEVPDDPDPTDPPTGAPAKLSLSSSVAPLETLPGDTVTYTLTATNGTGAGDATGTVVTDVLPDGVSFKDASEGCVNDQGTVRCQLGTIAAGSSKAATIRATVDPIPMKADPNTAHQILETKAETDLRVERGETKTATASCPTGYLATDGGIRLDAVDQGGDAARTSVPASGPTADGTGWTATLRNDNPGAALAKVTVACLARTTVTGEHQHDLVTTTASAPAEPLAAGSSTVTVACPAGQTPFAPSYALAGGGVVTTSKETGSSWTFVVDSPAAGTGDFGVACLGARTTTAAGHFHAIGIDHRAQTITVPAGQTVEAQLTCADEAKGIVASRRVDAGLVDRGTDPRAKIRAFRFTNPTDHALSADLGLTCVDIRTSGEPVSVRIANTATLNTTAADTTTADDQATSTFTAYGDGWAILPTTTISVAGRARSATVGLVVRCATDCVVSARLVALGRVSGTSLRAGSTLGTGRATLAAGDGRLTLRASGTAAAALTSRKVTRATVVITTSDGATTTKTVRLRR